MINIMEIKKSNWVTTDHRVSLGVPFAKIDEERRLVSGYATLDNIDDQYDVVLAEASARAFARARGNIREMHQPIAAGRLVDFKEDEVIDPDTGQVYKGIYVTAYVSKGAQDTWEKVLDGTLTGFSIGGSITESETQWVKDANANVRFVKDYSLDELSLVDNPANQKANILSIQKNSEGSVIKGMIAEVHMENIYYCETDGLAKTSPEESVDCSLCGKGMQNVGWFEGTEDKTEKVREAVKKFLAPTVTTEKSEGGVDMGNKVEKKTQEELAAEVKGEEESATEEVKAEEPTEEEAKAESVEEVKEEPDLEKMLDSFRESLEKSITESSKATKTAVETIESQVAEVTKALGEKTSELEKQITQLSESLEAVKESNGEVSKRLEAFEDTTAVKKSGEVETTTTEPVKKSKGWSGAFLGIKDLQ